MGSLQTDGQSLVELSAHVSLKELKRLRILNGFGSNMESNLRLQIFFTSLLLSGIRTVTVCCTATF